MLAYHALSDWAYPELERYLYQQLFEPARQAVRFCGSIIDTLTRGLEAETDLDNATLARNLRNTVNVPD